MERINKFKEINFGFASAEKEFEELPSLLTDGFFDMKGMVHEITETSKFVCLGDKGSGKTSLGRHISLMGKSDPMQFDRQLLLEDISYTAFSKIVRGKDEPEAKYPTAWSWILLIVVLDMLRGDHSIDAEASVELNRINDIFAGAGLVGSDNINKIILSAGKKGFSVGVPQYAQISYESGGRSEIYDIPNHVESFKSLILRANTKAKHFIILDGLDDILTKRGRQYDVLGALIFETQRLNGFFRENGLKIKIVILCRQDLFTRVSGANKNKIRQNFSIVLDWYHDPNSPGRSMLVELANHRAKASTGEGSDILEYFQKGLIDGKRVYHYLLDLTRHRPRDFIVLLSSIQEMMHKSPIDRTQILSGVRKYSQDYFLPEVMDELYGFVPQDVLSDLFGEVSKLKRREFQFFEAKSKIESRFGDGLDIEGIFNVLYDCGAIGNTYKDHRNNKYYSFKFRNQASKFNSSESIMMHRGLWKALNLA
ncbi:funZ protein [Paralimibaculum aggregatum]|uniref:FunZ protein n=1 Tax=Paralimibaculum aggregatum TaxID=3036245 RepID=A0ABQ6LI81_9RHOB|nr:hypothetical protein [Limibaculum sp. NKW23]GMG82980.1 funZ protein [Limibaculum sp. NKW23]